MARAGSRILRLFATLACLVALAGATATTLWWARGMPPADPLGAAIAAYERRDWPAAERAARTQLKLNHQDLRALRLLARALYRQANDQTAATIDQRLDENTAMPEDYFLRGQAFARGGQTDSAIMAWQRAVERDGHHLEARLALEEIFFRNDRLSNAERVAESLAAEPGKEALGEVALGQVHAQWGNPAGAAQALERALKHPEQWDQTADSHRLRRLLARSLLQLSEPARARTVLTSMPESANDPEIAWLLSRSDLQQGIPSPDQRVALARAYRALHLVEPEPAPFVGEGRCALCHKQTYQTQHKSRHARTYLPPQQFSRVPFPATPIADPANPQVNHTFKTTGAGIKVDTTVGNHVYQTIVDYAFGSGDRGLTLVGHDSGGQSFEFRLSYYAKPIGWDVTSGHPRDSDLPAAIYQGLAVSADEIRNCMDCHNTHPYAILTGKGPEASDRAIGCERCHGPGGNHLNAVAAKSADLAIARPSLATGAPVVGLCSECHSPRHRSTKLSPGSPDSVRFQGATFTWSRCYSESANALDCVTCHDPHRDVEKSAAWYESRCLECHSAAGTGKAKARAPTVAQRASNTFCPVQPKSGCIACHMPKRKTPMAHALFTDHFIRVHPAADLAADAPGGKPD